MNSVWIDVVSRWAHVGTAIVLLGGAVFARFVLLPSAAELPTEEHEKLKAGVLGRWKKFVHLGIALLLFSGFYNFFLAFHAHEGQPLYHGLIGLKILLAFAVFFIASAMVGRSSLAIEMRKNGKKWMGLIVLLGAAIVAISGYARTALSSKGPAVVATEAQ